MKPKPAKPELREGYEKQGDTYVKLPSKRELALQDAAKRRAELETAKAAQAAKKPVPKPKPVLKTGRQDEAWIRRRLSEARKREEWSPVVTKWVKESYATLLANIQGAKVLPPLIEVQHFKTRLGAADSALVPVVRVVIPISPKPQTSQEEKPETPWTRSLLLGLSIRLYDEYERLFTIKNSRLEHALHMGGIEYFEIKFVGKEGGSSNRRPTLFVFQYPADVPSLKLEKPA